MRLHLFVAATALSLAGCSFDALGIGNETGAATTESESTGPVVTTTVDPTTGDPTSDPADCGNSQLDPGEEWGATTASSTTGLNGSICKGDCTKNVCGDGYIASNEGCDDGNGLTATSAATAASRPAAATARSWRLRSATTPRTRATPAATCASCPSAATES